MTSFSRKRARPAFPLPTSRIRIVRSPKIDRKILTEIEYRNQGSSRSLRFQARYRFAIARMNPRGPRLPGFSQSNKRPATLTPRGTFRDTEADSRDGWSASAGSPPLDPLRASGKRLKLSCQLDRTLGPGASDSVYRP